MLSLIYWGAQCALGAAALWLGRFNAPVFLTGSVLGTLLTATYAHFLFWNEGHTRVLKQWGVRCALIALMQLAACVMLVLRADFGQAVLWVAAMLLLMLALHTCGRLVREHYRD